MTEQQAIYECCLRLGDNALVHSYRLSEWCGKAPILEEDLALTNFALDLLGRAEALLDSAGKLEGTGATADDLAYRRAEHRYRNALMAELPDADFATAIGRLLLMGASDYFFYDSLMRSNDGTLSAIAAKTVKEAKYHREHAADWTVRLGLGTPESARRMQDAIDMLWPYTAGLFEVNEAYLTAHEAGIMPDITAVREKWTGYIQKTLGAAGLSLPADAYMHTGGLNGVHTEHLGHILSEMQYLQRAYPDAQW